jgi:Ca-activated chloride channel homolog
MSFFARLAVGLAFATVAHPGLALAQSRERTVYASVLDRSGAPLTSLNAADFSVRENDVPREVLTATLATDPLRIAVLVDTSQAMAPHISDLRNALRGFFTAMQGKHEIALFSFGERPTLLADYTRDASRLDAAIGRVFSQSGSGAYLLDAIIEVSKGLRAREGTRSAILVITAEGPEFSHRDHSTVLDALQEADATLHSLVLTRRRARLQNDAAREREFTMANGAWLTGGRREDLLTSMALTSRLQELAAELKNQYRIVYARPNTLVPPEKVEVSVDRTGATVRAPRVPRKDSTTD